MAPIKISADPHVLFSASTGRKAAGCQCAHSRIVTARTKVHRMNIAWKASASGPCGARGTIARQNASIWVRRCNPSWHLSTRQLRGGIWELAVGPGPYYLPSTCHSVAVTLDNASAVPSFPSGPPTGGYFHHAPME